MIFLEEAVAMNEALANGLIGGGIVAFIMTFLLAFLIGGVAIYVYTSFAFMTIAKKTDAISPGIAWIPFFGPIIITNRISGMDWWPILLIIGIVIPFVGWAFQIAFAVFSVIWLWKTFEEIDKPGWWAILCIIPIINLIMIGIAAWSKD